MIEETFGEVLIVGEISNFKQHTSGHRYFTLKDADASISCVMWRSRQLDFIPADGMRVTVGGKLTVYAARGNYQLDCMYLRPDGVGELYRAFEKLKEELQQRGWFRQEHKKPLPRFPQSVGLITSRTGAAMHDVLSTIQRRFPAVHVIIRPALMQGEGASRDIAKAIQELSNTHCQVLIVARGGGSIEDLWSFNTENVARAIFECPVPIISAIGHETDYTIADFVADRRAATPTAAAELVTPFTSDEIVRRIDDIEMDITTTMFNRIESLVSLVNNFAKGTGLQRIRERLEQVSERVTRESRRLRSALLRNTSLLETTVQFNTTRLHALHPHRPLKLGYAVVERNQKILSASDAIAPGETIHITRWLDALDVVVQSIQHINRTNNGEEN